MEIAVSCCSHITLSPCGEKVRPVMSSAHQRQRSLIATKNHPCTPNEFRVDRQLFLLTRQEIATQISAQLLLCDSGFYHVTVVKFGRNVSYEAAREHCHNATSPICEYLEFFVPITILYEKYIAEPVPRCDSNSLSIQTDDLHFYKNISASSSGLDPWLWQLLFTGHSFHHWSRILKPDSL